MLISKINIKNFKNFDDLEINFDNLNVIVGANASGKSNFIQAIKFVKDIEEMGIENAISLQGGIDFLTNVYNRDNKNCVISFEFDPKFRNIIEIIKHDNYILISHKKIKYIIEIKKNKKNNFEIIKEEIKFDLEIQEFNQNIEETFPSHTSLGFDFSYKLNRNNDKLSQSFNFENKNLVVKLSNGSNYKIKNHNLNPIFIPFDIIKNNFNKAESLIHQYNLFSNKIFDFFVYDFDLKNSKKPTNISSKSSLEENGENLSIVIKKILGNEAEKRKFTNLLKEVLPFVNDINVEKLYDNSLVFNVKESFNEKEKIPSSLLSDGTIAVTAIIVAMFFEDKRLIIFEEPEKGIHPAIISKIMNLFYDASKNKQILITTHNPEILKHTKLEDIRLMNRNQNGFTTIIKPSEMENVRLFIENELGVDQLFTQNLLDN